MTEQAPAGAEFVYARVLHAPRELVFRCMTEPEHLTHFWGPAGGEHAGREHQGRPEVRIHQASAPEAFGSPETQAGFLTSLDRFAAYLGRLP